MNCSTPEWSVALDAEIMARLAGAGIPIREVLAEKNLEGLLHDILVKGFTVNSLPPLPKIGKFHIEWVKRRGRWPGQIRKSQRFPHHWLVARELVVDGFVPAACIRGWPGFADYALVDRRRGRRIARRIREFSPQRRERNATIRRNCQR